MNSMRFSMKFNGSMEYRLPQNLNISLVGVEGETLLVGLEDVAISSGAACTSARREPSHVLQALGLSDELSRASIRIGLGRGNTHEEVHYVISKFTKLVNRLRALSPD